MHKQKTQNGDATHARETAGNKGSWGEKGFKTVGTTKAFEGRWLEEEPSRKKERQVPVPWNGTVPSSRSTELARALGSSE